VSFRIYAEANDTQYTTTNLARGRNIPLNNSLNSNLSHSRFGDKQRENQRQVKKEQLQDKIAQTGKIKKELRFSMEGISTKNSGFFCLKVCFRTRIFHGFFSVSYIDFPKRKD